MKHKITYVDVETRMLSDDVEGNWDNVEAFGVSCAVAFSTMFQKDDFPLYGVYGQESIHDMSKTVLENSNLVVGYNLFHFDYRVLQPHTKICLNHLPTFDMLPRICDIIGKRVSLNNVASNTLGVGKSGEGIKAPYLFREGKIEELVTYCIQDVNITRRVFLHACTQGYLLCYNRDEKQRMKIDTSHWPSLIKKIISKK